VIRSIVLESLMDLGEGRWIPWEAISGFLLTDTRAPGLARLLDRWAQRCGLDPKEITLSRVAERIAFESLHVLGCVDIGEPDAASFDAPRSVEHAELIAGSEARASDLEDAEVDEGWETPAPPKAWFGRSEITGRILRITPRGRAYLSSVTPEARRPSAFIDSQVLRLGEDVRVAQIISLVPFVEVGRVDEQLDVVITPSSVSNALAAGMDAGTIRQRLESIAKLPEPVSRALVQASAVLGRAQFVSSPGFLWVDDPELRELLRTRRQTADLFIEPSPPGGLLVAPGVDLERVTVRCRTLGVEVLVEGEGRGPSVSARTGASASPDSESPQRSSTGRRSSGTRRREAGPGSRRTRVASNG
jgi:hypothetical protein